MDKISNDYIHELSWSHDFSQYTEKLLNFVKSNKIWNQSSPKWCVISTTSILNIPIFQRIDEISHKVEISKCVLRGTKLNDWNYPHCDKNGIDSLPLSLNIPLRSPETALTKWYNFDKNHEYSSWDFRNDLIKDYPERQLSLDAAAPYTVFSHRMRVPTFINTAVPHSAYNDFEGDRIILSIHFKKNESALLWNERRIFDSSDLS
jgi:hypothetical protein